MKTLKPNVIKASAIVLNDNGQLLVVRKKDHERWISLGGKLEPNESLEQALKREIMEEANLTLAEKPILFHTSPIEPAAGKPDVTVQIYSFLTKVTGEPKLNPEDKIAEFCWISKEDFEKKRYKLGSVLELYVLPELIKQGLLK